MSEENGKRLDFPKKRKVGFQIAQAILAVHERKKLGRMCNYKVIAARYNVSWDGLKNVYSKWLKGEIDLGIVAPSREDRAMDMREQHAKTLELCARHTALLLVHWEGAIYSAEDTLGVKGKGAHKRYVPKEKLRENEELSYLAREIRKLIELRTIAEKGYNSALEESQARRAPEKDVNPAHPAPIEVQTHVITTNDVQRALAALDDTPAETPPAQ